MRRADSQQIHLKRPMRLKQPIQRTVEMNLNTLDCRTNVQNLVANANMINLRNERERAEYKEAILKYRHKWTDLNGPGRKQMNRSGTRGSSSSQ